MFAYSVHDLLIGLLVGGNAMGCLLLTKELCSCGVNLSVHAATAGGASVAGVAGVGGRASRNLASHFL